MNPHRYIRDEILKALDGLVADGFLKEGLDYSRVAVEPPREAQHGDRATNAAMVLA
jgi:arginyl-tRNA synthetase